MKLTRSQVNTMILLVTSNTVAVSGTIFLLDKIIKRQDQELDAWIRSAQINAEVVRRMRRLVPVEVVADIITDVKFNDQMRRDGDRLFKDSMS